MKKNKFTPETVRAIIAENCESDLPDRVIECLKKHNGKPITTRILKDLPALPNGATWRLKRNYGWTALESSTYATPQGYADKTSINLILARSEASVPLNVDYVAGLVPLGNNSYGENLAYFQARRERNAQRDAARQDSALCQRLADNLNRYADAVSEMESARAEFDELTKHGTPLNPEHYDFLKLVDPHDKAKHTKRN